ncbi:MAG: hypothetical protein ABR610_00590 [Thermoanaerobaculia bacterium]
MKLIALMAVAAWTGAAALAQAQPAPAAASPSPSATRGLEPPAPAEAASVDAIVRALYAGVSHAPGEDPDWSHLRGIFLPAGRLIPPQRPNGEFTFLTAEDFIARVSKGIATRKAEGKEAGFSEREIWRKTDCYGNICQLFSTYESRYRAADPKPFARGINAIQLVKDGNRWWIVNVLWDQETREKPIPAGYLGK